MSAQDLREETKHLNLRRAKDNMKLLIFWLYILNLENLLSLLMYVWFNSLEQNKNYFLWQQLLLSSFHNPYLFLEEKRERRRIKAIYSQYNSRRSSLLKCALNPSIICEKLKPLHKHFPKTLKTKQERMHL